jgi:hypothetical protein
LYAFPLAPHGIIIYSNSIIAPSIIPNEKKIITLGIEFDILD